GFSPSDVTKPLDPTEIWRLSGLDSPAVWTLADAGGTYQAEGTELTFAGFGTLKGGAGDDTFDVQAGAAVSKIDGGGGSNAIDLSADPKQHAVALADWNFSRLGGFSGVSLSGGGGFGFDNIEALVGGGPADSLTGRSSPSPYYTFPGNWSLSGTGGTYDN